ncbi:HprK-related kinase A [Rhodoferax sp.]|uniref:HprK-related kinase A n=1 Tax=Rhodoferax sp. TaxID=50421 RepID=UPI00374CAB73
MRLRTGPLVAQIHSHLPTVAHGIALHYASHPIESLDGFADFHVRIARPKNIRRWLQPQVVFQLDDEAPFAPLPFAQAFPMLEWGLNWCVANLCHQYLTIHAAVVEKSGRALILPAPPGSGKSTLCAGLVNRGWRLLSDELTLIERETGLIVPLPRPISLKNNSIGVIKSFAPGAVFGPEVHDTIKGTVAYMQPPAQTVQRAAERARPGWMVLPKYTANADTELLPLPKAQALMHLADNAFNYSMHGREGFDALVQLVDASHCHTFSYSQLDEAVEVFDQLALAA